MGLYDQILIKDNHVDYAGSMSAAVQGALDHLKTEGRKVPVVVEVRNLDELKEALTVGGVDRLLLDNFHAPRKQRQRLTLLGAGSRPRPVGVSIPKMCAPMARREWILCRLGWLTHSPMPLDISLKSAASLEGSNPKHHG